MKTCDELLSLDWIRGQVEERYFQRGEEYFAHGHVRDLVEHRGEVRACVVGAEEYRVRFWVENGALRVSCTCPLGVEGTFCKHGVAAGLAWLETRSSGRQRMKAPEIVTLQDIEQYLHQRDKKEVVEMLLQQVAGDDRLHERLLTRAARASRKKLNLPLFRRAIDRATSPAHFINYREAFDFTSRIEEVVDSIQGLLAEGYAREALELAEYALRGAERALQNMDDSGGGMGGVLENLQAIHFEACTQVRPDPKGLAERLFGWEMTSQFGAFSGAAQKYAPILGDAGLAHYRALAEAAWAKVSPLEPGQNESRLQEGRFSLTRIMERLAQARGDVEALVSVKARDLSSASCFLDIAEICKEKGQVDKALEWAEKGRQAFPEGTDSRLLDFLAEEYHRSHRTADAMGMIWAQFEQGASLPSYQKLKEHAERAEAWPSWREKAWAFLREKIAESKRQGRPRFPHSWDSPRNHSDLVEILLWEEDVEAAWAEAKAGGCRGRLWMQLAELREADHPQDSIPIYQREVEDLVSQGQNDAYREAARLVVRIRKVMHRIAQEEAFPTYALTVRQKFKAKRNFMKCLDAQRIPRLDRSTS